jgi:hypothetical protein
MNSQDAIAPQLPQQAADASTAAEQVSQRGVFELQARHGYESQGRQWHANVIWVGSPLVVEMTAILASYLICRPERRLASADMRSMLNDWTGRGLQSPLAQTIADSVASALEAAQRDAGHPARSGPLYPKLKAAMTPVQDEEIIARAADLALDRCCHGPSAGRSFWQDAVYTVLPSGVFSPGGRVHDAIDASRWWFTHRDFILVADPPSQVHRESLAPGSSRQIARVHRLDGPAMLWPDGWSIYAMRGMEVPAVIIEHPETITVAAIEKEQNAELRRILIERYGWQRYIGDCGANVVDSVPLDHPVAGLRGARLLRKELPGEPEPIVYLEMINSTPEPDGSQRRYLTRVNPGAYGGEAGRQCHAAMASLWRYRDDNGVLCPTFTDWQEYRPQAES